jgi:hypothetical protein
VGDLVASFVQPFAFQSENPVSARYHQGISGKYVAEQSGPSNPGGAKGTFAVAESSYYSYDVDAAARLWKRSKAMTGAAWDAIGEGALPSGQAKW